MHKKRTFLKVTVASLFTIGCLVAMAQSSFEHSGSLEIQNTAVDHPMTVNGSVEAKAVEFNQLAVNGSAELDHVKVHGPVQVHGALQLKNSTLEDTLTVYGGVEIEHSTIQGTLTLVTTEAIVENATLHEVTFSQVHKKQILHLKNTRVLGSVHFDSGQGIVRMDKKSSIKGKVTGGTVEKK